MSVERGGEPAAGVTRERAVDAELVENPDDHTADVVRAPSADGSASDQQVECALAIAGVERRERLAETAAAVPSAAALLEPDPGGEAVGGEARRGPGRASQRAVGVAAGVEDLGERNSGVGAGGLELERPAQRVLVAPADQAVGLGRQQRVEELVDSLRRLRADELRDDSPSRNALTAGMP